MPAGRHSDSTPDSRRVRLYSRLPCGSYGAGVPTAVVCSRELVSCGDGGEGEPIGIERQREQVRMSRPSELRR